MRLKHKTSPRRIKSKTSSTLKSTRIGAARGKTLGELKSYRQKRDFKASPEPRGSLLTSIKKWVTPVKKPQKLMFVIQKHAASRLHYDFRLEIGGVLKSWAIPKGPSLDPTIKRLAVHVEDHPIEYGAFEGVIPVGHYGAGSVMIWDTGYWQCMDEGFTAEQAYRKGGITVCLYGKKLHGLWKLIDISKRDPKGKAWLLFKMKDEYADPKVDIVTKMPNSVVTKRNIKEIGGIDNITARKKQSGVVIVEGKKLKSKIKVRSQEGKRNNRSVLRSSKSQKLRQSMRSNRKNTKKVHP